MRVEACWVRVGGMRGESQGGCWEWAGVMLGESRGHAGGGPGGMIGMGCCGGQG